MSAAPFAHRNISFRPQYFLADLFGITLAVGVVLVLRHAVSLPGKAAVALFVLAMTTTLNHPRSVHSQQFLLLGYLCLLFEFTWQSVATFSIISPGTNSAADVLDPVSAAALLSARAMIPLFLAACLVVALRSRPWRQRRSWVSIGLLVFATLGVAICYFALYATFIYGLPVYWHRVAPAPFPFNG